MAEYADDVARVNLSWDVFRKCIDSLCPKLNVISLRENQLQALYSFVYGEEVFVSTDRIGEVVDIPHGAIGAHLVSIQILRLFIPICRGRKIQL